MNSYAFFASYYDALTQNVDYAARADYLCSLLKKFDHQSGITLDLACGTGSLTRELYLRGFDIYGIDGSASMLSIAQQKAAEHDMNILFLCQPMQQIDLYGTVDTVFCTLDSLNHLPGKKEVQQTFNRVSLFMNPGGYFIFDVNTIYKHRVILANNTFIYDTENVYCVWQNNCDVKTNRVHISLDFFEKVNGAYYRSSEHFTEKAYSLENLTDMLKKAGLKTVAVYDDLSEQPPLDDSQRIIIVAKK